MSRMEIIEAFDPDPDAIVRTFHCAVCNKQHLQTGTLARVWVLFEEGYSSQASLECFDAVNGENNPVFLDQVCSSCGGRGSTGFGDTWLECEKCNGKGEV